MVALRIRALARFRRVGRGEHPECSSDGVKSCEAGDEQDGCESNDKEVCPVSVYDKCPKAEQDSGNGGGHQDDHAQLYEGDRIAFKSLLKGVLNFGEEGRLSVKYFIKHFCVAVVDEKKGAAK